MNYKLFSYYDRVSGVYSSPIPAVNRASAIRQFVAQVAEGVSALDMELYEVGGFDIMSGNLEGSAPVFVCRYEEYSRKDGE